MKYVWLTVAAALAWFGLGAVAWFGLPGEHWLPNTVAAVICVVPALATLAVLNKTEHRGPVEALGAVLVAPLLRLVATLTLAAIAYFASPELKSNPARLLGWVTVHYLIVLVVETTLLLSKQRTATAPSPVRPLSP